MLWETPVPTYAIGDIHGRLDLLEKMLDGVREDAAVRGFAKVRLVTLGDYVDRGPDSKGVIRLLRELDAAMPGFECVRLKGNHEDMLLKSSPTDIRALTHWFTNGGKETLASFGWSPGLDPDPRAWLSDADYSFLERLELVADDGVHFFVHAGIRPRVALDNQDEHDLLWIRNSFLESDEPHPRVIVHGHTPTRTPGHHANRMNLDSCAFGSNVLTGALVMPDRSATLLHATPFGFTTNSEADALVKLGVYPRAMPHQPAVADASGLAPA